MPKKGEQIIFIFVFLSIYFTALSSFAGTASEDSAQAYKFSGFGGTEAGSAGTATPDLFTGRMGYSVPIQVSLGRKGMSPNLAITYYSNKGNGLLGVGWDLEIPAIERNVRKGLNYSGDGNGYVLRIADSSIELVSIGNNEYRAKIEGQFLKIVKTSSSDGSPQYWDVYSKTGLHYTFGKTKYGADVPRQYQPSMTGQVFKWCLDKVEDQNGNYMIYSYWKDQNQIYIDQIQYTGNNVGLPATNSIKFYWELRTDATVMYTTNFEVKIAYRLKTIYEVANGNAVRGYKLVYNVNPSSGQTYSASTGRSLLTSIQQYGSNVTLDSYTSNTGGTIIGGETLQPLTFTWQDSVGPALSGTFPESYNWRSEPGNGTGYNFLPGDFDGDGITDMFMYGLGYAVAGKIIVWISNGDGTLSERYTGSIAGSFGASGYQPYLADFNGDGKADIYLYKESTGHHIVWLNNGDGTFPAASFIWERNGEPDLSVVPADFNGDGKADLHMYNPITGRHIVWINNPSSITGRDGIFEDTYSWQTTRADLVGYGANAEDLNEDGKADIYMFKNGDHIVWLNNGNGTFPDNYTWKSLQPHGDGNYRIQLADFNGDNKKDIFMRNIDASRTVNGVIVWLNNGDGTFPDSYHWVGNQGLYYTNYVMLGDFNGDGLADIYDPSLLCDIDICKFHNNIWLNNGDGTFPSNPSWHYISSQLLGTSSNLFENGTSVKSGDFNGDGKADIYLFNELSGRHATWLNQGPYPDLLSSISNGIGGTTDISYKPSTRYRYTNTQLPIPVQTMSSITSNSGNGDVSSAQYAYSGGFFHIAERDFRGFNKVTVETLAPNGERKFTETWFHQGDSTEVISEDATFDELKNLANVTTGQTRGKIYRTKIKDPRANAYVNTTTTYAPNDSQAHPLYSFTPAAEVNTYHCEEGMMSCDESYNGRHTRSVYTYDGAEGKDLEYGNVTEERFYGGDADGSTDKIVKHLYWYDLANISRWHVSLPMVKSVYSGDTALVSRTAYLYDEPTSDWCPQSVVKAEGTGNLTGIVRWLDDGPDLEVRMAYDAYGNLVCTKDANGNLAASITYDNTTHTFPIVARTAIGHEAVTKYYGVGLAADTGLYGQVKSVTDANNAETVIEYDKFGRKKKEISIPDSSWTTWDYINFGVFDSQNLLGSQNIKIDTSEGLTSWTYFDGFGRTVLERKDGPDGKVIVAETHYMPGGAIYKKSMPYFENDSNDSPRYIYYRSDFQGRAREVRYPDFTMTQTCQNERVSVAIDANTHRKRFTKDGLGRIVKVEEYKGVVPDCTTADEAQLLYATTTYQYDLLGNLRFVTDEAGNQTEIRYDSLGRKRYINDPDMGIWTYEYDNNGNLKKQIDANGRGQSPVKYTYFDYDALNRIRFKDYPTEGQHVVTFTYDEETEGNNGKGRLTTMSDASGSTKYFFDKRGRTQKVIKHVDNDYTAQYSYDSLGRVKTVTYPDNDIVTYTYDTGGNLHEVKNGFDNTNYATYTGYNALGQAKNIEFKNGVTTEYTYYLANNLLHTIYSSNTATSLLDLSYGYDRGQINISEIDDRTPRSYSPSFPGEFVSYEYSNNHDQPHAVQRIAGGNNFIYDDNGNMKSDGLRIIGYDHENKPTRIELGNDVVEFQYDGSGARVKKIAPGGTTVYIGNLYECTEGICAKHILAGNARIAHKISDADIVYYHSDHLGSTRAISDSTGMKVEDIQYLPFGETRLDYGDVSVSKKYTSQEFDAETGFYYYNARYYNPILGKFISADTSVPDPLNPQAFNRYSYVLNNPLSYNDPDGHYWAAVIGAVVGAYSAGRQTDWDIGAMVGGAIIGAMTAGIGSEVSIAVSGAIGGTGGAVVGGMAGGAMAGGFSAAMTFGDVGEGIRLGAVSGAMFGYIGDFYGEDWTVDRAVVSGLAGETVNTLADGKRGQGFLMAGGPALARYVYNQYVTYDVTFEPGEEAHEKGRLTRPQKNWMNFGKQGEPIDSESWSLNEGSRTAQIANKFPGMNALSGLHDNFQVDLDLMGGEFVRNLFNIPGMAVAAGITYPALMTDYTANTLIQVNTRR